MIFLVYNLDKYKKDVDRMVISDRDVIMFNLSRLYLYFFKICLFYF